MKLKRILLALIAVLVLVYLAATRGLYFFPTSVALGPCLPDWTNMDTYKGFFEDPASPMGKTNFSVGNVDVQICYGRPSARARQVFSPFQDAGADSVDAYQDEDSVDVRPLVPDGRLWRMGANEPTRIFINGTILFDGLELPSGRYSFYARPDSTEWEIFVTRSTFHWGNAITKDVRNQEIGSVRVPISRTEQPVELLTIQGMVVSGARTYLEIKWADRKVFIPLTLPS